jgi:hypothetical protein
MLLASAAERSGNKDPEPAEVKPTPIAVLKSGLPIREVID